MHNITYSPLSEQAIIVEFGDQWSVEIYEQILQLSKKLTLTPFPGFIEAVPAYTTLTIYYDLRISEPRSFSHLCRVIDSYFQQTDQHIKEPRTIAIPVCYDRTLGPDLDEVAQTNNLTIEKVIQLHTEPTYNVCFLGFSPGFPFLSGMNTSIATPRKSTPRKQVAAGSVGIAGVQTGVYPSPSPAGWQIIGRTPVSLLKLTEDPPTLLHPGDRVQFYSITKQQFDAWEEK
ncbi:5-oxoprolinase subunit PxpB [Aquibacillus koreensis]|uniref:5-oxoprolinase subunit PxpB n=1 Tax=Aquibacillus koreensis TaxID=279446 RepID=A0A9X3WKQ7_9BACI|nr:5-oxoprolinase subunit PxpB [Aquibacillus koreensis]MCT2537229.1 5-oxoprolinase subunit PxpB [Aquibacillus koreensis]MDC3421577.1 5-oxoprolinase subunit PxpB [Aquibacillus koreensis]